MRLIKGTLALVAVMVLGVGSASAAVVNIDEFTSPSFFNLVVPEGVPTDTSDSVTNGSADIIGGGSRTVTLTVPDVGGIASSTASVGIFGGGGDLAISTGLDGASTEVLLDYDLDSFDGVANATQFIRLKIRNLETAEVFATIDGSDSGTVVIPESLALQDVFIDISGLVSADMDALTINITTLDDGFDAKIDFVEFTDVPEPATLALLGMGGLLIASRRRKA